MNFLVNTRLSVFSVKLAIVLYSEPVTVATCESSLNFNPDSKKMFKCSLIPRLYMYLDVRMVRTLQERLKP